MNEQVKVFAKMIAESNKIVVFSGAGISTASGIPDFRSSGGIYDQIKNRRYSGEEALSIRFMERNPRMFFENMQKNLSFPDAKPNFGHRFFSKLEKMNKEVTVITQNIDDLHEKAGSSKVLPLHGSINRWVTSQGQKPVANDEVHYQDGIAVDSQGRSVRPDIVLYGEQLNQVTMQAASQAIQEADLLIVVGTSLMVTPASFFVDAFQGRYAVLINQTEVPQMNRFDLVVKEKSSEFLRKVWECIQNK